MNPLRTTLLTAGILFISVSCVQAQDRPESRVREPIIGLPCEGCEAVFEGIPDSLASTSRIAPRDEPGEAMRIEGTVFDRNGLAAPGVIIYAYHTDVGGIYPASNRHRGLAAFRHGRLRSWAETDDRGRYSFDTIRPAGYPNTDSPAHVHMHVIEVGRFTYYLDSIRFEDDPRLSQAERRRLVVGRGGTGLVTPRRDAGV